MEDSEEYFQKDHDDVEKLDTDDGKVDISKTNVRYYMLFLACFLCFGNYFILR